MNIKRLLSLIMTAVIFLSILSTPTFAEDADGSHNHIEIIFNEGVSDEFKERATYLILNDEDHIEASATYAIACTVIGHVYDSENVISYSHRVYSTSPRCVKSIHKVETCLRCDYTQRTLLSSTKIICCS